MCIAIYQACTLSFSNTFYCAQFSGDSDVMLQIFDAISAFLYANSSLKFGYEWDRDYFITLSMTYKRLFLCILISFNFRQQLYMPIIGSLTIHPIIFYLLLFDHRLMVSEIRMGYFFLYVRRTGFSELHFPKISVNGCSR